jgi:Zn-dependent protease with chaperone function
MIMRVGLYRKHEFGGFRLWTLSIVANESEADRFAVDTINKPEMMIEALKKLSITNLSNLTPHPLYVFLNYSHPTLLTRLQTVEKRLLGKKLDTM